MPLYKLQHSQPVTKVKQIRNAVKHELYQQISGSKEQS